MVDSSSKKYLLVIGPLKASVLRAVGLILRSNFYSELELVVLAREINSSQKLIDEHKPKYQVSLIKCQFSDPELDSLLQPYKTKTIGVSCRSDKDIQDLRRVVKHLPKSVFVANEESLTIATNKKLMRQAFHSYAPSITPKYMKASNVIAETIIEAEKNIGYPLIVKPTNLASSLLIQSCDNRTELEVALDNIFKLIDIIYKQEERYDSPEVIIEEYLEGDFYSIDAYCLSKNEIYCCPPVSYIPAKQIGIDDFFLFKRSMPTSLSRSQIAAANKVCQLATKAVGLEYASAHIELVLTEKGWRVIELGPRLGRFRNKMYSLAYGIDHSLNDIKLHLGIKPSIPTKLISYTAAYSFYPFQKGKLIGIKGLADIVRNYREVKWHQLYSKPGDNVKFAKQGGHALAELIIASKDERAFNKLSKNIEANVYAEIYTQK